MSLKGILVINILFLHQTMSEVWISELSNVTLTPYTASIGLGTEISLRCSVDGSPYPKIKWYKNKIRVFDDDENNSYRLNENILRIKQTKVVHNGVYTCEGENVAGTSEIGDSFLLNIKGNNSAYLQDSLYSKTTVTVRDADVWIDCVFENAQSITWFKDTISGMEISNNTRMRTTVFGNGTLKIEQVKKNDEGTYICEGIGPDKISQSFSSELILAKLGKFNEKNLNPPLDTAAPQILPAGERFEVECLRPTGVPTPVIRWENSEGIKILDSPNIFVEGTKFVIEKVNSNYSGEYRCVAVNMAGSRSVSFSIQVTVPPVIIVHPSSLEVGEQELDKLVCKYEGTPYPWTRITWLFENKPIPDLFFQLEKITVDNETGTLTILRADLRLEGTYVCIVNTLKQQPVRSQQAFVNVIKKLKFDPEPTNTAFELGSTDSVVCKADAEIPPKITWQALPFGKKLPNGVVNQNGELVFYDVTKDAVGQYMCTAEVDSKYYISNKIYAVINITAGRSPQIDTKPENLSVLTGQSVMFHCQATGDPRPTVTWDKDDKMMDVSSSRVLQFENGSLIIEEVRLTDQAIYGCIAGNFRGFTRVEMLLIVKLNTTHSSIHQISSGKDVADDIEEKYSIGITKTIVIAVCSSVAYLALVLGLSVWCSLRLMKRKKLAKLEKKATSERNGDAPCETDALMGEQTTDLDKDVKANGHDKKPFSPITVEERISTVGELSPRSERSAGTGTTGTGTDDGKSSRNQLQTIGMLGKGMYGDVFLAKAPGIGTDNQLVFVKSLLYREENIQGEFKAEAEMYNKLRHDRICKLLALYKEKEPVFMVLEYCEWGDLKQFLLATSRENSQQLAIDPPDNSRKLQMCVQIASAMEYLSSLRFTHKDLASRNILLEPNLNVKLASLGLSKDIYASEYVESKNGMLLPLRWMSPEAWVEDDFSTKSDVWSYGWFVFEVFSGAEIPYPHLTNTQVISNFMNSKMDFGQGDTTPLVLKSLLSQCWAPSPKDRLEFRELVSMLSSIKL